MSAIDLPEIPDAEPTIESPKADVRVMMANGLTARQAFILWMIANDDAKDAKADRRTGIRSPIIADRCKISRQLAHHEVKLLVKQDLVRLIDSPVSDREKVVQLTQAGRKLLERLIGR